MVECLYELRKDREVCRFGGKTARFKGEQVDNWNGNDWRIRSTNPYVKVERPLLKEDGVTLFPVTEADDFLRGFISHDGHVLSRGGSWDSFPEIVEALALNRVTTYKRYYRQHTITLDVPIIGHLVLSSNKETKQPILGRSFMRWNGKLYDRNMLYTLKSDEGLTVLKPYGPLVLPPPSFTDRSTSRLNASVREKGQSFSAGSIFRLVHGHNMKSRTHTSDAIADSRGILIDLRRPMLVSHIGTMGGIPRVSVFPSQPPGGGGRAARGGKRKPYRKKGGRGHVYVVDEQVGFQPPHTQVDGEWWEDKMGKRDGPGCGNGDVGKSYTFWRADAHWRCES